MKKVLLKTKRFVIRNIKVSDVSKDYLNWFKDKINIKYIEFKPNNNLSILKKNVNKQIVKKKTLFLGIFDFKKKHIGNIKFHNVSLRSASCSLGILIGSNKWKNRGVGYEIIESCANYLFRKYKITNIYLGVYEKNKPAVKLFKKCGFVITKEKYITTNCYHEKFSRRKCFRMLRNHFKSKIVIGTAQLGFDYGIANQNGKMTIKEMKKIKKLAELNGINTIETAQAYEDSEKNLGKIGIQNFKVITKLPTQLPKKNINKWVFKSINSSMKKLKLKKLDSILIHHSSQLTGKFGKKIYKSLVEARKKNLINKIGVSVYTIKELKFILSKFKFDIVSVPFNIIDQRIKKTGWLKKLNKLKVDIHVRSAFLQGLLLLNKRPKSFERWRKLFDSWDRLVRKNKKTRLEICLGFILSNPEVDKIILGFDNYKQFKELSQRIKPINIDSSNSISSNDKMLINPSNWNYL